MVMIMHLGKIQRKTVCTELFPDIHLDVLGNALRIAQEDGDVWIDLSDVPKLVEAIKGAAAHGQSS